MPKGNPISMESKGVSPEELKRLYLDENLSLIKIGNLFGVGKKKIRDWLIECGVEIRYQTTKYRFNENYFDEIDTEEKAYWLGFVWCDGSIIDNNGSLQIKISLSEVDDGHLYKLKEAMKAENQIKYYKIQTGFESTNREARLLFTSFHMGSTLRNKYGMIPRREFSKPVTEKIPKHLKKHFIRGVFDADGSITTYWNKGKETWNPNLKMSLQLYSNEDLIDFIQDYWIEIGFKQNKVKTIKRHEGRDGYATGINFSGVDQVTWLLSHLYEDATIYLDRKMERVKEAFKAKEDRLKSKGA